MARSVGCSVSVMVTATLKAATPAGRTPEPLRRAGMPAAAQTRARVACSARGHTARSSCGGIAAAASQLKRAATAATPSMLAAKPAAARASRPTRKPGDSAVARPSAPHVAASATTTKETARSSSGRKTTSAG